MSATQTYEQVLLAAALKDPRVVVLTAENRAAIRNLPAQMGDRFIDVGICEQTMIGVAAGLALRGRVPVVHALATFLTLRAFEFIRTDVGIANLPVKLVGAVPGFLSEANGPTHQAIEDLALMRGIPGMNVVCPTDEDELADALPAILASPAPCYIRHVAGAAKVEHRTPWAFGRSETLREGRDVTLLVHGFLATHAMEATRLLEAEGVSARVISMRTLVPFDEEEVLRAARETSLLVTIEDHFATGALYTAVAELFLRRGVLAPVLPIALEGRWFRPAMLPDVLRSEGFTGPQLAARVLMGLTRHVGRAPALRTQQGEHHA